jgi:hypothetical protein
VSTDDNLVEVLSRLSSLPALKIRTVQANGGCGEGNKGLLPLKNLRSVKNLIIDMNLDDEGFKCIAAMKQLETLEIQNSNVTDDGLAALRQLSELRFLILYGPRITRRSVPVLASLPKLEELHIYNDALTDADWNEIRREKPNFKGEVIRGY